MQGSSIFALKGVSTLVITAGHGGKDSGAVSGKFNERDEAISIVDQCAAILRGWLGDKAVVVAPHAQDTHETLPWINARYGMGKAWALELHRDSADTVKGDDASLRCGVYHGRSADSTATAQLLIKEFIRRGAHSKSWARPQTDSRHGGLMWINGLKCFSHLIELGFMEGANDPAHLTRLARIAAAGIARAFTGQLYTLPEL